MHPGVFCVFYCVKGQPLLLAQSRCTASCKAAKKAQTDPLPTATYITAGGSKVEMHCYKEVVHPDCMLYSKCIISKGSCSMY